MYIYPYHKGNYKDLKMTSSMHQLDPKCYKKLLFIDESKISKKKSYSQTNKN